MMILQGIRVWISYTGVCYANNSKKEGGGVDGACACA